MLIEQQLYTMHYTVCWQEYGEQKEQRPGPMDLIF